MDVHNELIFLAGKVIDAFFPLERPLKNPTHPKTKVCDPYIYKHLFEDSVGLSTNGFDDLS